MCALSTQLCYSATLFFFFALVQVCVFVQRRIFSNHITFQKHSAPPSLSLSLPLLLSSHLTEGMNLPFTLMSTPSDCRPLVGFRISAASFSFFIQMYEKEPNTLQGQSLLRLFYIQRIDSRFYCISLCQCHKKNKSPGRNRERKTK